VNKQGEAAFKRLSDVHDVHVPLCPALLSEFNGMKYAYAHTITRQYMMASGAFVIENPDKAADTKAANLSAVESVLKTYQAILKQKPDGVGNLVGNFIGVALRYKQDAGEGATLRGILIRRRWASPPHAPRIISLLAATG
jgi:hypothetical protein